MIPVHLTLRWWLRAALIVAASAILFWSTLAVTVALVTGQRRPEAALRWWPNDPASLAAAASNDFLAQSPAQVQAASGLATRALRLSPTAVVAARVLGMAADARHQGTRSLALFHYAESLSRRDLQTQLWWIEENVRRNDIDGALRHYDRALRTVPSARDILLPILVQAADDPAISGPLTAYVARRPLWWPYFLDRLNRDGTSPAAIDRLVRALRLNPAVPEERAPLAAALDRLVELGAYGEAEALYEASGQRLLNGPERVRNGNFEQDAGFGPFAWDLADQPGLAGVRTGSSAGWTLSIAASPGRRGDVARQLLRLRPGGFELAFRSGSASGDPIERPLIKLVCAGAAATSLIELRLPPAPASGVATAAHFSVPASGCAAQWLVVGSGIVIDERSETPWVDDISVRAG